MGGSMRETVVRGSWRRRLLLFRNSFSLSSSLMRFLASSSSFCSPVLAWVTFPVLPYLMIQTLRVLSLIPNSEAHSLMLFFGFASRAFL